MSETHMDRDTIHGAAHQAEKAVHRVIDAGADAIPSFGDAARATADALRVAGRKASAVMTEFGEEARDAGVKTRDEVVTRVQAQPLTSVLVAAALGFIAGLMLPRH